MTKHETYLIKTAIGIHLIKEAAEQTDTLDLVDSCTNTWCNFVSDIVDIHVEQIMEEGTFINKNFTTKFINSSKYKTTANRIMKTLIWLNILPGYIV